MMNNESQDSNSHRVIFRTPQFDSFYSSLPQKVIAKFDYVFLILQNVYNIPAKFVKHLENTNLYEMRVSTGSNEYRSIIFTIDHTNIIEAKKIILLSGFLKKSTKDYKKQIEAAIKILEGLRP